MRDFEQQREYARRLVPVAKEDAFTEAGFLLDYCKAHPSADAEQLIARRLMEEPLQYVLGEWEFFGLPFRVDHRALIPRPDTELLCEIGLSLLNGGERVLDLCCGSGCIGVALAHELPAAHVLMVDISERALEVSRENIRLNRVNRAATLRADALEKPPMSIGQFDLIVSNPPYVASFDILTLDSSVRDYEPLGALDGGEDGLTFSRAIIHNWIRALRPGGLLMFEVGEDQAASVRALMREGQLQDVFSVQDTAGIERVVVGRRQKD
jgi:release factor glutamine methyltransferase